MLDLNKIPNEVILFHLYPIAYGKEYYFYKAKNEADDGFYNKDFYDMVKTIFNPNFEENIRVQLHDLKVNFEKEKQQLIDKWECGEIDIKEMSGSSTTLYNSFEKKYKRLNDLKTIRNNIVCTLEKITDTQLEEFKQGKPLLSHFYKRTFLVATPNHFIQLNENDDHFKTYYGPSDKEKFDKLFGKTTSLVKPPEKQ